MTAANSHVQKKVYKNTVRKSKQISKKNMLYKNR